MEPAWNYPTNHDDDYEKPPPVPKDSPNKIRFEKMYSVENEVVLTPSLLDGPPIKTGSSLELSISEIPSDSDVSCVNYYDVENSQIYKKPKEENAEDEVKTEILLTDKNQNEPPTNIKPTYTKFAAVPSIRYNKDTNLLKKRHKSDSELFIEDSFDTPPTVLNRKKDNTIISKIYNQLHVRNFALSSRKQVPVDATSSNPNIHETSRYSGGVALYNSEGETASDKIPFNDSREDLIEYFPKKNRYNRSVSAITYTHRKYSISSEEDVLSDHSTSIGQKTHIYNSSDDLFSIEEQDKPHKKKDNTLIDKIYQNPQVRNYALVNRDYIPAQEEQTTSIKIGYSSEDDTSDTNVSPVKRDILISEKIMSTPPPLAPNKILTKTKSSYEPHYGVHLMSEMNLDEENEKVHQRDLREAMSRPDPEIEEIAKKKIVHNILDKLTTSNRNVASKRKNNPHKQDSIESDTEVNISVRELRKKFEKNNVSILGNVSNPIFNFILRKNGEGS